MDTRTRWWVIFSVLLVLLVCCALGISGEVVGLASSTSSSSSTSTTDEPSIQPLPPATTPPPTSTYSTPDQPPLSEPTSRPSTTTTTPSRGPAGSQPGAPLVLPQGDDAVSYQMTPGHTGYSPDKVGPLWRKSWTKTLGGPLSYPLIVDGEIYVVSQEDGGSLLSIDAATGSVNWQVDVGDSVGIAYANGDLFSVSTSSVMSAYSATRGALLWSTKLPNQWEFYAPTAGGGMVYAGAAGSGGTVYGVDASNGQLVWTGEVENGNTSIPAISSKGVFVSYACQQTYDFDPRTGTPLWHHSTSCEGGGGATAVVDGAYLFVEDLVAGNVVLNASNGSVVRSFKSGLVPAPNGEQPTPATNGAEMFVLDQGTLQEETVAGGLVGWSFAGDGGLESSPIVVNGSVYEGSDSGMLYAVSATSGAQEWSTDLGTSIAPNIVEGDNYLIVPTTNALTVFVPA